MRFSSSASRRVAHCVSVRLRAWNLSSTLAPSFSLKLRFFRPFISLKPSTRAAYASQSWGFLSASNHSKACAPLVLIAGDAAERLVAIGIVAEPAPGQDVIDLVARIVGRETFRDDPGVAVDALEILLLAQFVAEQFVGADCRAENFRGFLAAPILLLVAIFDPFGEFFALLRALSDIAGEFDVHLVDRAESAYNCADLFDRFKKGAPRDRTVDVLQRNGRTRGVIIADTLASLGIDQALAKARNDGARSLG